MMKSALNLRVKTLSGLLVPAPKTLRAEGVNFLLIENNGKEYHLMQTKKTLKMWNLVDTRVELRALQKKDKTQINVLTYKCIDDFVESGDFYPLSEELDFHPDRFDWAI